MAARGLAASLVGQILVRGVRHGREELGWKWSATQEPDDHPTPPVLHRKWEADVVHTGILLTAPMLTISENCRGGFQKYILRSSGEANPGHRRTNVQFAHDPKTDRVRVIEINPRTSRSSRHGLQGRRDSLRPDLGHAGRRPDLDEIQYWSEGTLDKYTPGAIRGVKFARWISKCSPARGQVGTRCEPWAK